MSASWSIAVSWITIFLNSDARCEEIDPARLVLLRDLSKGGVTVLKATEVKKLGMQLDRLIQPLRHTTPLDQTNNDYSCIYLKRPVNSAKKQEWIYYVHRCFFSYSYNNVCRCHDNTNLIWAILRTDIQRLQHTNNFPLPTQCATTTAQLHLTLPISQHVSNSVYSQNPTVTAHNLMDVEMDTNSHLPSDGNDAITTLQHKNTQIKHVLKPNQNVQTTSNDHDLASCGICGCLGVDTEFLPCGHLFHRWCLEQCCIRNSSKNQSHVQTCPVCRRPVQSTNFKTSNNNGNHHECKKAASAHSIPSPTKPLSIESRTKLDTALVASINKTKAADVDTIDLISYPNGPPPQVIKQMHKQSQTGTFRSKLASIIAKEKTAKVKIKLERGYPIHVTMPLTHTSSNTNDNTTHNQIARNPLEEDKVSLLRQMGFTDLQEMLTGLRHVENDNLLTIMDADKHAQSAMLWIVSQREEADEARRVDEVRMRSEVIVIEDEVDRNDPLYITQNFSNEVILGQDNGVSTSSELFPSSVILESSAVKALFRSLLIHDKSSSAVVRLLILEKKIRQWFGSKIPNAYFHHILRDKIEGWQHNQPGLMTAGNKYAKLTAFLLDEIMELENALYTLSQQEKDHHTLGMMVPKAFLRAREKFAKEYPMVSNCNKEIVLLDDDGIE